MSESSKNRMLVCEVEINPKKGKTQATRWLVCQDLPQPSLGGRPDYSHWRGDEGMFRHHLGDNPVALPALYRAELLRTGIEDDEITDESLTELAGHDGAPGTIVYRGRDMGLTYANIVGEPTPVVVYTVRCGMRPTLGEHDFLRASLSDKLLEFVAEHRAELREAAIDRLEASMLGRLKEARAQADQRESEARLLIQRLRRQNNE